MEISYLPYNILLSENRIKERITELGEKITIDYRDRDLVVIGILKGSLLFFADLIRRIHIPLVTDFLTVSSYEGNTKSSGNVKIISDATMPVKGRDILLIEDIIDTGATTEFLFKHILKQSPGSLKICTLLNKKSARRPEININVDYSGFDVPNKFLIGYGLDYKERYRNLPYIAAVEKQADCV